MSEYAEFVRKIEDKHSYIEKHKQWIDVIKEAKSIHIGVGDGKGTFAHTHPFYSWQSEEKFELRSLILGYLEKGIKDSEAEIWELEKQLGDEIWKKQLGI